MAGHFRDKQAQDADDGLRANETAHDILSLLLRSQAVRRADAPVKGGLAPAARRRLREYIEAHLTRMVTLSELAELACLSEFHFSRMFRASFDLPPHGWIAQQRLDRARTLLRTTTLTVDQIAAQCGYADASHFGHRFRAAMGAAPLAYRRAMRAA